MCSSDLPDAPLLGLAMRYLAMAADTSLPEGDVIALVSPVSQDLLDEIGKVLTWPATHAEVVEASKRVPDEVVQMITASGTPDEVQAKVAEYVATGCTCPILYPMEGDVRLMIDVFGS